jgi:hypothetical protein
MSLLFPTLAPHTLEILQSAVDENAALCKEEERQELEVRSRGRTHHARRPSRAR